MDERAVTRFVILSAPRTGSTLLASGLGRHPGVRMHGEVLNDEEDERRMALIDTRASFSGPSANSTEIVAAAFDAYLDTHDAVGLKLLYQHLEGTDGAAVWSYLRNNDEVRVIHVTRRDVFAGLVSLATALVTDRWARTEEDEPPSQPPVAISADSAEQYFRRSLEWRERVRVAIPAHRLLEIGYEDDLLGRPYAEVMTMALTFLGVTGPVPREPALLRQSHGPVGRRVLNLDELRTHFAATRYAHLLEEPAGRARPVTSTGRSLR